MNRRSCARVIPKHQSARKTVVEGGSRRLGVNNGKSPLTLLLSRTNGDSSKADGVPTSLRALDDRRAARHPCRLIQDSSSCRGITSRMRSALPGCQ